MAPPRKHPRELARQVLRRVEQGEAYASLALAGALERSGLAPRDRALATELVYGVLRHQARLDRALDARAARGLEVSRPVRVALRLAAYQILFLRTPPHAAVNDAVKAVRAIGGARMAGFANGLLRALVREGEPPLPAESDPIERAACEHSLPRWIVERLPAGEVAAAAAALNQTPAVSLRVNLTRATREAVLAELDGAGEAVPYLPEGVLVRGAGAPDRWPAFQEGRVTPQDIAAQLVGRLVDPRPGERVLDACAGVGGKSTHLQELALAAGGPARIDAADLSARKLDLAQDSARRLGLDGIRFVTADLTRSGALEGPYDRILLDAPCSGLGVLRRHPEARTRVQPSTVTELAALQARLLETLVPLLSPGGRLVYSVCTFTEEEGPGQVAALLAAHPELFRVRPDGPVDLGPFLDEAGAFRSWPHRTPTDAFFAAVLVRS